MGRTSVLRHLSDRLKLRVRQLIRQLLSRISRCGKCGKFIERKILVWQWAGPYFKRFGVLQGLNLFYRLRVKARNNTIFAVHIPQVRTPIFLRAHTSDIPTFQQILVLNEYELPFDIRPNLIVDGGANVGYATIYFANKFPEARIIAVEPDASNVELLRKNTVLYSNVTVIEAAIWNTHTTLFIENPQDEKWAFRVNECDAGERAVSALTMDEIIKMSGYDSIDILKLDIEGAEREVFSQYQEWLSKVRVLIIELHDRLKPGCSSTVYSATSSYTFTEFCNGENVIMVRK